MADTAMLYQSILNILLNSFHALKENGIITISTWSDPDAVHVCFTDTGDGISEDLLNKIWTPFFTTKDTGTGLGLGIVKNIIEAHKGQINITNAKPLGTKVEIILPIQESC
jgi:signal transduction histidine kinase